ncbi:pyridoxal 5'-phosphate synthase glutaminase subunit PdxT [Brevibacillus ginsengisoli]|uniref:pyridoxal 5'-phosphate synthase glutaminase subunit PdxT n=1 Tax=Brevibacillus ginsengisoli TaxID=363854 RepID=UPI003CE6F577
MSTINIGVLGLQGAVAEHVRMLETAGVEVRVVKKLEDLEGLDGLVIPGGESTTISKLMNKYGFMEDIREFAHVGKPIMGTCAGAILLANRINGQDDSHLKLMDIKVERNAFGRQKESFEVALPIAGVAEDFPAVFIRAPYIMEVGLNGQILSQYEDKIVAARDGQFIACAFHPELTEDNRFHQYFVSMVKEYKSQKAPV